jgi:hypothetical protein
VKVAVIVGTIAISAEYWEETQADGTQEAGCRVQLRHVRIVPAPVPPPVPRRDAVFWSIEEPVWRADLFSEIGGQPYDAAHFHPTFAGLTPCDRVFDPTIQADPLAWITRRLGDVPGMLAEAGRSDLVAGLDRAALEQALPAVLEAIRVTLAFRPAEPTVAG